MMVHARRSATLGRMALHVKTVASDLAPYVLLPGDPGRATHIAENFLDACTRTTDYRGLLGYTGTYEGVPVSVQTTGMGCPSLAIVVEELARLGARTAVRVGTAGTVADHVRPGDVVIAQGAVPLDGTTRAYLGGEPYAPIADFDVTRALVDAAGRHDVHVGLICTEDAFYATTVDDLPKLSSRGVLAVEMESSALFLLARMRGMRAGTILAASNRVGDSSWVDPDVLTNAVDRAIRGALDATVALAKAEA